MAITKSEALQQVQSMVAEVTRARFEGGAYAKLARAHGYADGYMKALLDLGIVERDDPRGLSTETRASAPERAVTIFRA